jgi:hypothetical protein
LTISKAYAILNIFIDKTNRIQKMTSIEVQTVQDTEEKIPVNTRDIFIKLMEDATRNGQILTQPLEDIQQHQRDAEMYERLANQPTTDEMRLEQFGIPLPEGHPVAPHISKKIGASALR